MTIEQNIADMLQKKLSDGSIEKIIEEKLTKCIGECMEDMFRWNGSAKALIEEKLKAVMIPAIEKHDFSEYTVKLDAILTEVVNATTLQDNKQILSNFKSLMIENTEKINLSDVFYKWCSFVEKEVDTSGLEVEFDDGPRYESVNVEMSIEDVESVSHYSPDKKVIRFTCEHDEDMNLQFEIYKYDFMKAYKINGYEGYNINGLKNLKHMDILLARLGRDGTEITIDEDYIDDCISPQAEPEATFN